MPFNDNWDGIRRNNQIKGNHMLSFKQYQQTIDEGFFKRLFGFDVTPEERLERARDSIRWYKKYMQKSTTGKFFDKMRILGGSLLSGGVAGGAPGAYHLLKPMYAWEYLYVWGTPEEKREAETWLRTNPHPLKMSELTKDGFWSHESKQAALYFANTRCCVTGSPGTIKNIKI